MKIREKRSLFTLLMNTAFAALVCSMVTATVNAQTVNAREETPGLEPGEEAPAFVLKDQEDVEISLESLIAEKPVAIVFHRSARW